MAYVKTNWTIGDTITAQKLNNLENGLEAVDGRTEDITEVVANPEVYGSEDTLTSL